MNRDWKYILYISLAFGAFLTLKLLSPKKHNWTVTFAAEDKNPFGGFAMNQLVRTLFPDHRLAHSFKTIYELKDSVGERSNVLIVAETFSPGKEDTEALLNHVHKGGHAFISSQYIYGVFADTLKLSTYDTNFKFGSVFPGDSATLFLTAVSFDSTAKYTYRHTNVHNYLSNFDTTRTSVIALNERRVPVTIRVKWGAGSFLINCTPMMFTNINLLSGDNSTFVSSQLSYLLPGPITWTEYYQRGRREINTPLRFILLNEPLSWAYYIAIISLIVFMVFEVKRRQRIIPVIAPLRNTTLEFVATIGDLYYQNGDHKNIAEKKIIYFLEQIRSKYGLGTNVLDNEFAATLARKAGQSSEETIALINLINLIRTKAFISVETLIDLNNKLETFNRKV